MITYFISRKLLIAVCFMGNKEREHVYHLTTYLVSWSVKCKCIYTTTQWTRYAVFVCRTRDLWRRNTIFHSNVFQLGPVKTLTSVSPITVHIWIQRIETLTQIFLSFFVSNLFTYIAMSPIAWSTRRNVHDTFKTD